MGRGGSVPDYDFPLCGLWEGAEGFRARPDVVFDIIDRDGSGLISVDDFRQHRPGITGDGLSGDEVDELLREAASLQIIVDDGRLDYIEFVRVLMAK